jgi:ABC-type polysaccharide/polyol phosphate export permease
LQLGFWMTPIFWSETSMNENILVILQKNPLYYIVTGYRDALINGIGFWEQPISSTLYFWCVALVILALGVRVYVKLRDHFADLL